MMCALSLFLVRNDIHSQVVLLDSVHLPDCDKRFRRITPQEGDLDYDYEPERTLLRKRREARRRARQAALEQQLNMAAEHQDDNLNLRNNQNRVTLGQYINPTADSCGSTDSEKIGKCTESYK
ncbi:hypothetical protein PIB30_091182 [Stylosanthes scabra]|uniref:IBB domain-containing protein n=1 Tax=Stylosanthes scabra TaxID=79078 RepID=A0ABU6WUK0_9FABA|nr:hypothetical protein [Stylosanthes scabra]